MFAELGRLPRRGDTVNADGFSIRVESVRDNRVEAVRIRERRAARSREGDRGELAGPPAGACGRRDLPVKHVRPAGG